MSRPSICRNISGNPISLNFEPAGVPLSRLTALTISLDELEAIHLKDLDSKEQEECAKLMNISQPTFHRLLLSARQKIADAIVNGKSIRFAGGNTKINSKKHVGCFRRGVKK